MQHQTVIVVAGGDTAGIDPTSLPPASAVVAADGGLDRALTLGLRIDVAVGDFDSASPEGLAAAEASGARIERHPADKDATDLELALDAAAALEPQRILVLGAGGGRLDHALAALLAIASARYAAVETDALLGSAAVHVIHGQRRLVARAGELVSLLAVHGPAEGVVTQGLVYPLRGETLAAGSTRGVSNVFAEHEARVSLERGVLLAVRPEAREAK